jgi:hypothetical protein
MISRRSIETLIDLVENKLSQIISVDRGNMKEFKTLQSCADELQAGAGASATVDGRPAARLENQTTTHERPVRRAVVPHRPRAFGRRPLIPTANRLLDHAPAL